MLGNAKKEDGISKQRHGGRLPRVGLVKSERFQHKEKGKQRAVQKEGRVCSKTM